MVLLRYAPTSTGTSCKQSASQIWWWVSQRCISFGQGLCFWFWAMPSSLGGMARGRSWCNCRAHASHCFKPSARTRGYATLAVVVGSPMSPKSNHFMIQSLTIFMVVLLKTMGFTKLVSNTIPPCRGCCILWRWEKRDYTGSGLVPGGTLQPLWTWYPISSSIGWGCGTSQVTSAPNPISLDQPCGNPEGCSGSGKCSGPHIAYNASSVSSLPLGTNGSWKEQMLLVLPLQKIDQSRPSLRH